MNKGLQKLLLIFLLATVAAYSAHDIANLDIWYHLKSGELIFDRLEIPRTNTFSYIAADHPSFNFYWLFQILVHFVYRISGISGLILIKIAILTTSFFLLFTMRNKEDGCILPVFSLLLAVMAANGRFIVRPELASYMFLCLYFFILHRYHNRKGRSIYLLIPLQIFWANMHGFWALGLFLVWAFLAGELVMWKAPLPFHWKGETAVQGRDYYRLFAIGLMVTAVTLITPHPQKIFQLAAEMFAGLKGATGRGGPLIINELISPFSANPLFSWQAIFYYKMLLVVSAVAFVLNFRRINITHLLIYVGFLYLSIQARRNIAPFALISAPITFWNLGFFYRDYIEPFTRGRKDLMNRIRAILSAGLIVAMILFIYDAVSDRYYIRDRSIKRFGFGIARFSYPEKAIDFIQENNIQGNMFNEPAIGHYITWRCFPKRRVFLDGRFDFPERFLSHYYVPELWQKISERYNINYVLLGHGRFPDLAGLVRMLYFHKEWALIYYDEMSVVFIRNVPANQPIIEKYKVAFEEVEDHAKTEAPRKNLFGALDLPVAQFQLGNLYATLGLHDMAIKKYKECIEIAPKFWEAHSNLGGMYQRGGRVGEALREYKTAVEIEPDFAAGYVRLGDLYAARGNMREAIVAYKQATDIEPGHVTAHRNLALLYVRMKDYKKGVTELEAVLEINPGDQIAHQMLTYCRSAESEELRAKSRE